MLAIRPITPEPITVEAPPRRTLMDTFAAAMAGDLPRQPHNDGAMLITEAFIAQECLKNIGKLLHGSLKGIFEIGPEKDLQRAHAKTHARGDLSLNCDFSRARMLLPSIAEIRKAIDLFGQAGVVQINNRHEAMDMVIVDVDNTFSLPNAKKPGFRNLDIKIAIPITLAASGVQTFHVCELQFLHKQTARVYDATHNIYEQARQALLRQQILENAMEMSGDPDKVARNHCPETFRNLEKRWHEAHNNYIRLMQQRESMNTAIANKLGLNALDGYQPCNNNAAKSLQCSMENVYEMR